MKNFYEPVHDESNVDNGEYGEFDLYLYKLGTDETTELVKRGQRDFDGILVVRSKLQWFFEDNAPHTWQNDAAKLDYLRNFQNQIDLEVNHKYCLVCPGDSDFKKVYVYFVPSYYFEGSTIHDHFEITVKANSGTAVLTQPDYYQDGFDSSEFTVDKVQKAANIYRYVLGLSTYSLSGTNKVGIDHITVNNTVNDLQFLETWMFDKRGRTYHIQSL
jgi:hypothetical protein